MNGQALTIVLNVSSGVNMTAVKISVSSFVNPYSVLPQPANVSMTNAGVVRFVMTPATYTSLIPSLLPLASISALSQMIADPNSKLNITFTTRSILRASGQVYIQIPLWNPSDLNPS